MWNCQRVDQQDYKVLTKEENKEKKRKKEKKREEKKTKEKERKKIIAYKPGCHETHYVVQTGLKLTETDMILSLQRWY